MMTNMQARQTLIVGDIQGCYSGLRGLLDKCEFDATQDQLLCVGDIVARGEDSLATVDYLMSLGERFSAVLGNHDLHLLAVIEGIKPANKKDNLANLLASPAAPAIARWLRQFPLAMRIDDRHVMVHAGLYPGWGAEQLLQLSAEVSAQLQGPAYQDVLSHMYGNGPLHWHDDLSGDARMRFIINACTRMRFVTNDYKLNLKEKGTPASASNRLKPWYLLSNPQLPKDQHVVFGHWAALEGRTGHPQFIGLDTGYVWGNKLTALRLHTGERISFPS